MLFADDALKMLQTVWSASSAALSLLTSYIYKIEKNKRCIDIFFLFSLFLSFLLFSKDFVLSKTLFTSMRAICAVMAGRRLNGRCNEIAWIVWRLEVKPESGLQEKHSWHL